MLTAYLQLLSQTETPFQDTNSNLIRALDGKSMTVKAYSSKICCAINQGHGQDHKSNFLCGLLDASYDWNKVPEDLHGDKELNSSKVAVYLHDSHKHASQRHYLIPINIPILEILQYPNRGIKEVLAVLHQFHDICISCPTGIFTRLKR